MSVQALSHLRVLDLSRVLAGPWATQMLSDLGAEVIKVEHPRGGDDTRSWGPPWVKDDKGRDTQESTYYACANRGKRSVTVDITTSAGQSIIEQLVAMSDILIENYKCGGLRKYGLDYEALAKANPALIYCSITGFGHTGPYRHRAGYDFLIQGMGGLMGVTGAADDRSGAGPQKVGVAVADIMTGLYASNACLAALAYREQTGKGQHIDLSLLDVQVATLANQASSYLMSGIVPGRLGNAHPSIVPYQAFSAEDGHFIVAVGNDKQFRRLCQLLEHGGWADDKRFATNASRVDHRDELTGLLERVFATKSMSHWIDVLERAGVPCGPINTIEQVFSDPQVQARNMIVERHHCVAGPLKMVDSAIRMSESEVVVGEAPPLLGQHTSQVLEELLGIDAVKQEELQSLGAI